MKEKILTALKAKFQGGNANILNRIAEHLAKTVTTEEAITTAVEGVTSDFIELMESYGDSRATDAQRTAVANYERKHGLKQGKPIEQPAADDDSSKTETGGDDVPDWAKKLLESNKQLTERLNQVETERTAATRKQQLMAVVGKLPEKFRKPYERIQVENLNDEDFGKLLKEVGTEVDAQVSDIKSRGAVFGRPQGATEHNGNELTKEQEAAIAVREGKSSNDGQPF